MTRLDGEKKSPLPWIIGLLVLALLAAAIYYFTANKSNDAVVDSNAPQQMNVAPVDPNADNSANVADANTMDANMADANMADVNAAGANAMDSNSAMSSDSNMATGDMAGANGAMDSNSVATDNSVTAVVPVPGMTPASANPKPTTDPVVATRSKTIKTDDKTVIYEKSVKSDGTVMRDKKIVAEPVKEAKKQ